MMANATNLDDAAATLPPWNLRVTIGGQTYPVRQPTLAEETRIADLTGMKDAELIALFWSLFADPKPDGSAVTRDTLMLLWVELLVYRQQRDQLAIGYAAVRAKQLAGTRRPPPRRRGR